MSSKHFARVVGLAVMIVGVIATVPAAAPASDLDPTFGDGGVARGKFMSAAGPEEALGEDVAVARDGTVVVAGHVPDYPVIFSEYSGAIGVARFTAEGELDSTFSGDGKALIDAPVPSAGVVGLKAKVATLADGSVVVASPVWPDRDNSRVTDILVAKFTPAGDLDASFGGGGIAGVDAGPRDALGDLEPTSGGGVIVAGLAGDSSAQVGGQMFAARFTANGALDPSYGAGGVARVGPVGRFEVNDAAVTEDGVALAGREIKPKDLVVGALDANGAPRPGFGRTGFTRVSNPSFAGPVAIAAPSDERLVVASGDQVARLTALDQRGRIDREFGRRGHAATAVTGSVDAIGLEIASGGRLVYGGSLREREAVRALVVRFRGSGAIDRGYSGNGKAVVRVCPRCVQVTALAMSGERPVVAGSDTWFDDEFEIRSSEYYVARLRGR